MHQWTNEELPNRASQFEIDDIESIIKPNFKLSCSYSTGENLASFKNKLIETYVYNFYQLKQPNVTDLRKSRRGSKKEFDFKVLLVGNKEAGQYELLQFIDKKSISVDEVLSPLRRVDKHISYRGKKVNLHFFGTPGDEEHQRIRTLAYSNTDVIVLVFSLIFKESLHSLFRTFMKEIKSLAPKAALLLVGVDLEKWDRDLLDSNFVMESELDVYANNNNLFQKTILCSLKNGQNLNNFGEKIIEAYLSKNGDDKSCTIF